MTADSEQTQDGWCWRVSTSGYECVPDAKGELRITDLSEASDGGRRYSPLDDPVLYLRFAETRQEPDAICEFATRQGFLESGKRNHRRRDSSRPYERLDTWIHAIQDLRGALEFYRLLQTNQIKKLGEFVQVVAVDPQRTDFLGTYSNPDASRRTVPMITVVDPFIPDKRLRWVVLREGDVADVQPDVASEIRQYLTDAINERLNAGAAPKMRWDSVETRFRIQQTPNSLLGAIWLQFALAVAESKRVGECEWCGDPFEISRKASRADRKHCSDKCRSKAYRHRKETAVQLATAGFTLDRIAQDLGSDKETVERWIQQHESSRKGLGGKK